MAQERPLTPEKQLLNLIESNQKTENNVSVSAPSPVVTQTVKRQSMSLFAPEAWVGRLFFFRDSLKKLAKPQEAFQLDVKLVNRFLASGIFVFAFYLAATSYLSMANFNKSFESKFILKQKKKVVENTAEILTAKNPVVYYLDKVSERDIFKMGSKKKEGGEQEVKTTAKIIELTQGLRLVGISWSDNPDAMIEDTKASRTFFIKKNDMIGDIKVKDIFKDKIILGFEDEEVELR